MKIPKNEILFWTFLSLFAILIFILNHNHLSQQTIYHNTIIPLAESILSGNGYSDSNGQAVFYPLWGYSLLQLPGLTLGIPSEFTLFLQFVLSIIGVFYFYKIFPIKKSYFHIILFLPFFAIMSVKIPDAIVAFLILPYIFYSKRYFESNAIKDAVIAGLVFAVCANFRSEYLFLPIFQFIFFAIIYQNRLASLKIFSIVTALVIIGLMPWSIRSHADNGEYRFTASNGGSVAYISLGQLSGNKWGVAPFDSTAFAIAQSKGYISPYTPDADRMFKDKFYQAVLSEPIEFAKKAALNAVKVFYRGVYTGEFANLFIPTDRREKINHYLLSQGGAIKQIKALQNLPLKESLPIVSEKAIQLMFMLGLFSMFIILIYESFKKSIYSNPTFLIILALVIYRIATIAAIQYEYRHVNSFYILIVGIFIMYFISKAKR